jgi:hypothetical protein
VLLDKPANIVACGSSTSMTNPPTRNFYQGESPARPGFAILELRRSGRIDDAVMRRVERDLDLEDARLDL